MDNKIIEYQKTIETFLRDEAKDKNIPGIECLVVADLENSHFLLIETGWYEKQFIYSVLYHFHIKTDGKIWLLANNTDNLIAEELVKKGIPATDIVIAFHPEHVRPYTAFAVA